MPTYDEITPEILEEWKIYLENITKSLLKNSNKYVLRLFIISLYEYIVVKTAYLNHIQHDPSNQRFYGGLNIIKKYISNSTDYSAALKRLMYYANDIRHNAYKSNQELEFLGVTIKNDSYLHIWNSFIKECPLTYTLLTNIKKLTVLQAEIRDNNSLKRRCIRYTKDCLAPQQDGNSKYNIGEVIFKIVDSYNVSESYAKDIVIRVISEQVVSK